MWMELLVKLLLRVMQSLFVICIGWSVLEIYECAYYAKKERQSDD